MRHIDHIAAHCIDLPLRETFQTARRRAASSATVIITVCAGDITGYGEATPVGYVTGEDTSTVLRDIRAASEALDGSPLGCYRELSRKLPLGKSASAGIEMAILDAISKGQGVPLYSFLGGEARRIETDVTIPVVSAERARARAAEMSRQGFTQFKVKVGTDEEEDLARAAAVAEGAPGSRLILDANQGFAPDRAVSFVKRLLRLGVEIRLLEQPVDAADLEGMSYVTERAGVPVFADESAQTPADVIEIVRRRAANGINVKMMKCGILGALEIASICKAAGLELMFGCMLESRIAQSAALHVACATGAFSVFDLDSDLLIAGQPISGGFERRGPVLEVSNSPGLGCEVVDGAFQPLDKPD